MNFFWRLRQRVREYFAEHGYTCDCCGIEVFDYANHRLCEACQARMPNNDERVCPKCGRKTLGEGVCLTCKAHLPDFTKGYSAFVYKGRAASLVNRLKNGQPHLGLYFGEKTAEYFLKHHENAEGETPYLVIPVPLTEKRKRDRGYNQAEELAEAVCNTLNKNGIPAEMDLEVLQKNRETGQQKHMSALERRENISGAYHIHKRKECRDRMILLIDDILTTGATGGECAKLLKNAGAKAVYFLTPTAVMENK